MPEKPPSSRSGDTNGNDPKKSPRTLRVAKPLPSSPASSQAEPQPSPSEEGVAMVLPLGIAIEASEEVAQQDPFAAEPRLASRRLNRLDKKKSRIESWQIAVLALLALVAIGGGIAALLSQTSPVADSDTAAVAPGVPRAPLAAPIADRSKPIADRSKIDVNSVVPSRSGPRDEPIGGPAARGTQVVAEDSTSSSPKAGPAKSTAKSPLGVAIVTSDNAGPASSDSGDHPAKAGAPDRPAPLEIARADIGLANSQDAGKSEPSPKPTDPPAEKTAKAPETSPEYSSDYLKGRSYRRQEEERSYPAQKAVVDAGLIWLARHQLADGGWAFEHRVGECRGRCPNPGDLLKARVAATGLALLPFLGAGHSHLDGPYRRNIAAGLKFIMAHQGPRGGMVEEGGQMYGHGIATLALCEAFGVAAEKGAGLGGAPGDYELPTPEGVQLTPEQKKAQAWEKKLDKALRIDPKGLRDAARRAVGIIVAAQHPQGGWRYHPGEAGDMSVVGWQIMALASAQQAGFGFDKGVRDRAFNFLRICGGDLEGDEHYGVIPIRFAYMPPDQNGVKITQATTAIGLLSMIYMGIHPQHPGMELAVQRLLQQGPNGGDMYYTYYANQVMYQHGGAEWEQWKMRTEQLLHNSQAKLDHLEGSWFLPGDLGSSKGGRVYCTVMALLCLQENYRHMRIFKNAVGNQQGAPAAAANNGAAQPNQGQANNGQPNPRPAANPAAVEPGPAAGQPIAPAIPPAAAPGAARGGDNLPAAGFDNGAGIDGDLKPLDPSGG